MINNCKIITILPLVVECVSSSATNNQPNGSIRLNISGGTPPYTISWNNNQVGIINNNLLPGEYVANISDKYNDFNKKITCVVNNEIISPTPTPTPTTSSTSQPTPTPTPTTSSTSQPTPTPTTSSTLQPTQTPSFGGFFLSSLTVYSGSNNTEACNNADTLSNSVTLYFSDIITVVQWTDVNFDFNSNNILVSTTIDGTGQLPPNGYYALSNTAGTTISRSNTNSGLTLDFLTQCNN